MRSWISASLLALLAAAPAFAQSAKPGDRPPSQGSEAASPGNRPTTGAPESKSSGKPAPSSTSTRSGAAGISGDRVGTSNPPDDSAEAYKKDFQKK